jgi:hypothetical protein
MERVYRLFGIGLAWIAIGVSGCTTVPSAGVPPPSQLGGATSVGPLPPPPVITRSYASPRLRPGETWRVYLIGSSSGAELKNVVCVIDQPGVGEYPVSITKLRENPKEINGYVYLATSAFQHLNWVFLTLTVQVQDAAGQYSQPVKFHLSFNDLYRQEPPPPGVFKDHDLGPILINVHGLRKNPLGPFQFGP